MAGDLRADVDEQCAFTMPALRGGGRDGPWRWKGFGGHGGRSLVSSGRGGAGPRRRSGAPHGEGLFEVARVLGAVGGHRIDDEDGRLVRGQVRVVQDVLADVDWVG